MNHFPRIKEALEYIDSHLEEPISLESLAGRFHFSPYYFHRMFSVIVGKTLAVHIRDRRLQSACCQLIRTGRSVLDIGLGCGYGSAPSFSRSFRDAFGLSPTEYRRQGIEPAVVTVDEMIMRFTNRLRGGIDLNPNIIKRDRLFIAGLSGDAVKTGEIWCEFMRLAGERPISGRLSDNGYEVRVFDGVSGTVHVGYAVPDGPVQEPYTVLELPAGVYASFDVYVQNGYDSENNAMLEWLRTNREGYSERLLHGAHFCVEYYDERFSGSEAGSIVEIWVPVEKR